MGILLIFLDSSIFCDGRDENTRVQKRDHFFSFKKLKKGFSPTGYWTRVSRVAGGDTYHYTIEDYATSPLKVFLLTTQNKFTSRVMPFTLDQFAYPYLK